MAVNIALAHEGSLDARGCHRGEPMGQPISCKEDLLQAKDGMRR